MTSFESTRVSWSVAVAGWTARAAMASVGRVVELTATVGQAQLGVGISRAAREKVIQSDA